MLLSSKKSFLIATPPRTAIRRWPHVFAGRDIGRCAHVADALIINNYPYLQEFVTYDCKLLYLTLNRDIYSSYSASHANAGHIQE